MQMPCDYHKRVREAASEPCHTVGIKIQPRSAERGISGPPQREGPVPQQRTWWVMTGHQPLGAPIPAPASWPEPLAALVAPGEVPFLWRRHKSGGGVAVWPPCSLFSILSLPPTSSLLLPVYGGGGLPLSPSLLKTKEPAPWAALFPRTPPFPLFTPTQAQTPVPRSSAGPPAFLPVPARPPLHRP